MSEAVVEPGAVDAPVPIVSAGELLPYAIFAGVILMLLLYFVGAEDGATAMIGGTSAHELLHDARHLLGFPCH
jgi:hypothetical protein